MIKNKIIYHCSKCDAQFSKWTGRCLECGAWGTVKEISNSELRITNLKTKKSSVLAGKTVKFDKIVGQEIGRLKTGIEEFDRVLGGGLAPGSLILLGGEPGIGKSTLVLQIATTIGQDNPKLSSRPSPKGEWRDPFQSLTKNKTEFKTKRDSSTPLVAPAPRFARNDRAQTVLYASGEESAEQIKLRFDRLGLKPQGLEFLGETGVETICATIEELKPQLAIVDSLQTLSSIENVGTGLKPAPTGSPTLLKMAAAKLMETAKNTKIPIILIGHVTKEGGLSGPKTLEHLVDAVLYLEGERFHQFRILRAVKNRFGSTNEAGIFEMTGQGLKEVSNPSAAFLSARGESTPGSVVTCLIAGSRPILLEIQALVSKTQFGYPQRRAAGFDLNRLQVLIAVLAKRTGLPLETYDVFLNVVGGLKADEPAADLAVVLAIASALKNKTVPTNLAAFGEVGLGGEVRAVGQTERRLGEIKKMGFEFAVIPQSQEIPKPAGLKIAAIKNVKEIVEKILQRT